MLATRSFAHGNDTCLALWAHVYARGTFDFPPFGRVLEIGCAEADWMTPMIEARPDLFILGVDWRPTTRTKKGCLSIQGDILKQRFAYQQFDAIVGVSSLEHIGLGHYDHDPLDPDGDIKVAAKIGEWLAPGGWCYFDVPYQTSEYEVRGTECRIYDERSLAHRFIEPSGLDVAGKWYASHDDPETLSSTPIDSSPFAYCAVLLTKHE